MRSFGCCTSHQSDNEHVEENNGQRIEPHQHSMRDMVLDKDHHNLISEKEKKTTPIGIEIIKETPQIMKKYNYSDKEYDKPLIDEKFIREEEKPHITFVIIRNIKSIKRQKMEY